MLAISNTTLKLMGRLQLTSFNHTVHFMNAASSFLLCLADCLYVLLKSLCLILRKSLLILGMTSKVKVNSLSWAYVGKIKTKGRNAFPRIDMITENVNPRWKEEG